MGAVGEHPAASGVVLSPRHHIRLEPVARRPSFALPHAKQRPIIADKLNQHAGSATVQAHYVATTDFAHCINLMRHQALFSALISKARRSTRAGPVGPRDCVRRPGPRGPWHPRFSGPPGAVVRRRGRLGAPYRVDGCSGRIRTDDLKRYERLELPLLYPAIVTRRGAPCRGGAGLVERTRTVAFSGRRSHSVYGVAPRQCDRTLTPWRYREPFNPTGPLASE